VVIFREGVCLEVSVTLYPMSCIILGRWRLAYDDDTNYNLVMI
jgi:hypothetical protein